MLNKIIRRVSLYLLLKKTRKYKIGRHEITLPPGHLLDAHQRRWRRYDVALGEISDVLWKKYPGFSAIDVGANIGDTAALIASKHDINVLCVEGSEDFLPLLRLNSTAVGSEVEECFVGEVNDDMANSIKSHNGTLSVAKGLVGNAEIDASSNKSLIEIMRRHSRFMMPKLIKIDTDGMDFHIIRNSLEALQESFPIIYFEYDTSFLDDSETESIATIKDLLDVGYETFIVYDNFGNQFISINKDHENKFKELNRYLRLNRENTPVICYFDICAVNKKDVELASDIMSYADRVN